MANLMTTPVGRYVFGDPTKAEPVKDDRTGVQKTNKAGEPLFEHVIGLAFAKNDPAWLQFKADLLAHDRAAWPQFTNPDGTPLPGVTFANKIYDGDSYDTKGRLRSEKDGWGGHEVLKLSSGFAPRIVHFQNNQWVDMANPSQALKRGDYVQAQISTASNESKQTAGMYRNLHMLAYNRWGEPIAVGIDPNDVGFSAPPPPVAGATPPAPSVPLPTAAPVQTQAPAPYTGYMQAATGAPPPAPSAPVPPPAAQAPAPAPAPVKRMTAKAGGATYESFVAQGWTDVAMIQQGYLEDYVPV